MILKNYNGNSEVTDVEFTAEVHNVKSICDCCHALDKCFAMKYPRTKYKAVGKSNHMTLVTDYEWIHMCERCFIKAQEATEKAFAWVGKQ